MQRTVQDGHKYDNSIFDLDSKTLMNGICKIFKWSKFTIDYSMNSCTEDGYNLIKTGKLVMDYHDIINDASVRNVSCDIYSCPKCNRVYIKNNIITYFDYRIRDISKIKAIKVLDNNSQVIKKTENPFYIDDKIYKDIKRYFINSIEKHTGYTSADIVFSKYVISTCKYDKTPIIRDSKLVLLEDNSDIILGGRYCPKCHRLYFNKNDFLFSYKKIDVENKTECPVRISIYNPIKQNREELIHTITDNQVTYLKAYRKELGRNLIIRCLSEEREISELSSILNKYESEGLSI